MSVNTRVFYNNYNTKYGFLQVKYKNFDVIYVYLCEATPLLYSIKNEEKYCKINFSFMFPCLLFYFVVKS